jgi:peptidyl-prolyl cis-trans isomerase D
MRLSTRIWQRITGKSFLLGVTVVAGIAAFAVTGVTQSLAPVDTNMAAQVGNQHISLRTLETQVQRMNRRDGGDESQRLAHYQEALNSLIESKIIVEQASRIGWHANDVEVAQWIRSIPVFQDEETKTFSKKKYEEYLRNTRMSELELYQQGRDSLATQKYSNLLNLDSVLPQALAAEYAKRRSVRLTIEFAELTPNPDTVKKALQERVASYIADAGNMESLQKLYEERKAEFNRAARTRVSSVLIAYKESEQAQGEALSRSKENAQDLASQIQKRAESGEDFATLAAETNDDLNAKTSGGDLGFVDSNTIDSASIEAIALLSTNDQVSPVVETPFGFRIFKRTGFEPAVNRDFESVKSELAERQLRQDVQAEMRTNLISAFEEKLTGENPDLAPLMAEHNIVWQTVQEPLTTESRFVTEIGMAEPVLKEVFALQNPGELAPRIISAGGKSIMVKLLTREDAPPTESEIQSTKDLVVAKDRQSFAVQARQSLYNMYSADGEIKRNASIYQPAQ